MILTAQSIEAHVRLGSIVLEPFESSRIGTVSYHFRAGREIARVHGYQDSRERSQLEYERVPDEGYLLQPDSVYLLSTFEVMGSTQFAQRIFGTRSTGSCGLFIDVSADLGHVGCVTRWTLELVPSRRMLLFPHQTIGQITFWALAGSYWPYHGSFQNQQEPRPSALWRERP